jgi:uncharacterized protein
MNTISIIAKGEKRLSSLSIEEFEAMMHLEYHPTLVFRKPAYRINIQKRCEKAERENFFSQKQKWLSAFHAKEILAGALHPGLFLQWIDSHLGYGVFALKDIPAHAYIGEYSGELRRRKMWETSKNNYCFDYSFGDFFNTPFLIDAEKKGSLIRFINHSEQPNLEPIALYAGGIMHIVLISLEPIQSGAQLTYDYGRSYWAKRERPILISK